MQILTSQNAMHYSTFRLPAVLSQVWLIESLDELSRLRFSESPLVLGEGSNSIFLSDIQRPILRYLPESCQMSQQGSAILLHVEAGFNWHQLVQHTVLQGWWGIENLALIPGSVGAAPVQNIGAYGTEFVDVCEYVDFYHWQQGLQRLTVSECQFGYRDSIFKRQFAGQGVIVAVGLRLSTIAKPNLGYRGLDHLPASATVQQVFDTVINVRRSKLPDPTIVANCGSFFKNPVVTSAQATQLQLRHPTMPAFVQDSAQVKLAAAWLIEQAGFKGQSSDGIGCYPLQPLVLVNLGHGTAEALQRWMTQIIETVERQFGVTLEPEVRMYHGA